MGETGNVNVGVITTLCPANVKQLLLIFDKLAMVGTQEVIRANRLLGSANQDFEHIANEIEFCANKGFIIDIDNPAKAANEAWDGGVDGHEYKKYLDAADLFVGIRERFSLLSPDEIAGAPYVSATGPLTGGQVQILAWEFFIRSAARIVAHKLRLVERLEAVPVFNDEEAISESSNDDNALRAVDVNQVILKKVPMPSDSVPWEKIIEFRQDPNSRGFLHGLRVWMHDAIDQKLSRNELEDKLDWLLFTRMRNLESHKMAYNIASFGAGFVAGAEILENLVKIKWGKAASAAISLVRRKSQLLKLEMETPQQELHYLLLAQKKFKSD